MSTGPFYNPRLPERCWRPRYWSGWLVVALLWTLSWLPLLVSRAFGGAIGAFMYATNAKRRRIVRVNLRLCFPEKTEAERAWLLRRYFVIYGQSFTDVGHLAWNRRARIDRMVRVRGVEHYRALLQQSKRVILLVPHCVGINVSGAWLSTLHPTFCIIKPLRNPIVDWMVHRARTQFGGHALARDQGLRPAISALKRGETFHYSPDEDLGPEHSVFVPFFGIAAATLPTLGRIAQLTDAVVLPCFVQLRSWGRGYEVVLQPPLANFPSGDQVADAARMNAVIEQGVRAHPEQYNWTLKLFRTRPDGSPSPYSRPAPPQDRA